MIVQGYCGVFKNVAKNSSEWYAVERIDSAGMGGGGNREGHGKDVDSGG